MNNHNKKDTRHGYWEVKYSNGKPWFKYTPNNHMHLGYLEAYYENGKIYSKGICI